MVVGDIGTGSGTALFGAAGSSADFDVRVLLTRNPGCGGREVEQAYQEGSAVHVGCGSVVNQENACGCAKKACWPTKKCWVCCSFCSELVEHCLRLLVFYLILLALSPLHQSTIVV